MHLEDRISIEPAEIGSFCRHNRIRKLSCIGSVPRDDMRNRPTPGCGKVDYAVIWSTVWNDLPPLASSPEAVLESLEHPGTN